MKSLIAIFVCFVFVVTVKAQEVFTGECKDFPVQVVQNFDVDSYLGKWYEQFRYESIFQAGINCVTTRYGLIDENEISVVSHGTILNETKAESQSIEGVARFADPSNQNEAKLVVEFPSNPELGGRYWVIGTDYDNYAVVWSCTEFGGVTFQYLWVSSRKPLLSSDKMLKVNQIIDDAKLDKSKLRETNQKQCTWSKY